MNSKQVAPLAATLAPLIAVAPQLLFFGGLVALGIYLLSSDDKKPETASVPDVPKRPAIPAGNPPIPASSVVSIIEKSQIPQNSAGKSAAPAPTARVPAVSVPAAAKIPVSPQSAVPAPKIQPEIPQPARKKIISRQEMAKIFYEGRGLTRKAAVSALKALGYGKTAAYQALEINGRFASWLQFAPDGIITWKN